MICQQGKYFLYDITYKNDFYDKESFKALIFTNDYHLFSYTNFI